MSLFMTLTFKHLLTSNQKLAIYLEKSQDNASLIMMQ